MLSAGIYTSVNDGYLPTENPQRTNPTFSLEVEQVSDLMEGLVIGTQQKVWL